MPHAVRVAAPGLVAALLLSGCAETPRSFAAAPTGGTGAPGVRVEEPAVTAQEAQATALESLGAGWIAETTIEEADDDRDGDWWDDDDRDDDDGPEADVDVWEVTVVLPDGARHVVSVDMAEGNVVASRIDD